MTNKEYKKRLNDHITFSCYDYMYCRDTAELAKDITKRKRLGEIVLDGFNKRASIKPLGNGDYILTSYYTVVCEFVDGQFNKRWEGYSVTTLKHINLFRQFLKLPTLSKREWVELPTI